MTFNSDKFECMRYWADPMKAPAFQYKGPDEKPIKVKTDLRDLGVQLSSDLSFKIHYYTGCPIETEQKYWLITRVRNNFRGQTICHFFTDTCTFWYLV